MSTKELVFESFPIHEYLVDKMGYKVDLEFELRTAIISELRFPELLRSTVGLIHDGDAQGKKL